MTATLAGCALQSPPPRADIQRDALPNTRVPAAWQAGADVGALLPGTWLASFDDPALTALVAEALVHNADLQVALDGGFDEVAAAPRWHRAEPMRSNRPCQSTMGESSHSRAIDSTHPQENAP